MVLCWMWAATWLPAHFRTSNQRYRSFWFPQISFVSPCWDKWVFWYSVCEAALQGCSPAPIWAWRRSSTRRGCRSRRHCWERLFSQTRNIRWTSLRRQFSHSAQCRGIRAARATRIGSTCIWTCWVPYSCRRSRRPTDSSSAWWAQSDYGTRTCIMILTRLSRSEMVLFSEGTIKTSKNSLMSLSFTLSYESLASDTYSSPPTLMFQF